MPDQTNPRQEQPSTYFVQDRSNREEMARLQIQDQMATIGMGGVLAELAGSASFQRVLDVGCGTGGWLIELAKTYPDIKLLIGVDISKKMVDYANSQAKAQGVSDRVEFHIMDALRDLAFPTGYFDLVNQRFGVSYLRTWDWPKLLEEYQRVCKPGGIIRVTECELVPESSSPAHTRLCTLMMETMYQSGHLFTLESDGIIKRLPDLLSQYAWIKNVEVRLHPLHSHTGSPQWQSGYEDTKYFFRVALPFLRRWTSVPDNYDEIYQQALAEMQQPDFEANWKLLTAWGTVPLEKRI
ncbi:MAG TPA: methyltransferase domain-containing protein [Ktedonosporobacter sp.]|nr:methyltransferase domain-containing protein [Ktedonosporobacter sp.]